MFRLDNFTARLLALLFYLILLAPVSAQATSRGVALVIGNAQYAERPLKNPVNDARDLAEALKKSGFEVMLKQNLTADQMKEAIADFGDRLARERSVGLFYFSGHGMQTSKGQNFLLPVGRGYKRERDVEFYAVEARSVLNQMEAAGNPLNIVVLDACRDAPLPSEARSASSKGLARMEAPSGSIIAFATAPGRTASDNPNERNGLYTKHLIAAINTPGLRLEDVFKQVGRNVEKDSNRQQSPEEMMKLRDDTPFFFMPGVQMANLPPMSGPGQAGGVSLADLERERTARTQWTEWQTRMQADYDKVTGFQGGADLRAQAWQRFLEAWKTDNPYNQDDDGLRERANLALASAQEEGQRHATELQQQEQARRQAAEAERQKREASAAAANTRPGQSFQDCPTCPEMVAIPAGNFMMGSNEYNWEKPVRRVTLPAFALGKTEVTFAQWDACVAEGGCNGYRPEDAGWGRGNRPVIHVSWDDAQTYVQWLSRKTGQRYRLPSEAEWEYAARAGTTTHFNTGACITADQANFDGNRPMQGCPKGVKREQTLAVASFAANAWGLHDMHGNVWEWTQDCWKISYSGAPSDGSASTAGDCNRRRTRGG